ncbi:MAG: general secretion pathway protein GspL [Burkholderiaceae bacterium]|nr:MAG: general secretion pathway protein GspL [Burkholderiaceae bacterium]
MSHLIVYLPLESPGPATLYGYALPSDRHASSGAAGPLGVANAASAPVALLPRPPKSGGEVVAVVPLAALSWHRVTLPQGTGSGATRLRAVLDGLLEERVLDDPETLHFAVEPQARGGATVWVAACDRAWLRGAVGALETAQRPVSRIVPEFAPDMSPAPQPVLYAVGTPEQAALVLTGRSLESGVTVLPLNRAGVTLALPPGLDTNATEIVAEPAVAELAEQLFQHPVRLEQPSQRWLRAAASPWDLAQFELASSGRIRVLKQWGAAWQALVRAPRWRALRWGVGLLLLGNLIGLNAWAWHERSALEHERTAVRQVLTQTFPSVRVVVDAPVQMEREVAALRQATGAVSGHDLEAILAKISTATPVNKSVNAIEYGAGEVRVKGLDLSADATRALLTAGYTVHTDGDSLVVRQETAR